jgi:DMSO/TMAO reductase YedYZ molybdopterin-dependent catalytic subunit
MSAWEIGRSNDANIREFDLSTLQTLLTPKRSVLRSRHFEVPNLKASSWSLQVNGHVRSHFKIGYSDLVHMPSRTITATLECAGNGVGVGAVSTASWTGVPLGALFQHAGLQPGVKQIPLVGADRGIEESSSVSVPLARSLPVDKVSAP